MSEGPHELRIVITAADFAASVRFYADALGLPLREEFVTEHGNGVILDAGRATLEILDEVHAAHVDAVEVGSRVGGLLRLAFEVDDAASVTDELVAAGATTLAGPTVTPWNSLNSRLEEGNGVQLTIFQEL